MAQILQKAFATAACAGVKKEKGQWIGYWYGQSEVSPAGPRSPEAPGSKVTYSPTPSTSVKIDVTASSVSFRELQKYSPGFEKNEKIKKLKEKLYA